MTDHQQKALARAIQFLYAEAEKSEATPMQSMQNIGWGMRKATEHIEFVLANYDILHIHKLQTDETPQD